MRRSEEEISRAVLNWKLKGKIPRRKPRKKWLDVVKENLEKLGVQE